MVGGGVVLDIWALALAAALGLDRTLGALTQNGRHAMPEPDDDTKRLRTLCALVIVIAGVLFATLWPFNPFPSNQVSWLPNANGVRFGTHGVIVSKSPLTASTSAGESCS